MHLHCFIQSNIKMLLSFTIVMAAVANLNCCVCWSLLLWMQFSYHGQLILTDLCRDVFACDWLLGAKVFLFLCVFAVAGNSLCSCRFQLSGLPCESVAFPCGTTLSGLVFISAMFGCHLNKIEGMDIELCDFFGQQCWAFFSGLSGGFLFEFSL